MFVLLVEHHEGNICSNLCRFWTLETFVKLRLTHGKHRKMGWLHNDSGWQTDDVCDRCCVRFAEKNSWYITQMVELLQKYGDLVSSSCTQQLVDVIKHGRLFIVHVQTTMHILYFDSVDWVRDRKGIRITERILHQQL